MFIVAHRTLSWFKALCNWNFMNVDAQISNRFPWGDDVFGFPNWIVKLHWIYGVCQMRAPPFSSVRCVVADSILPPCPDLWILSAIHVGRNLIHTTQCVVCVRLRFDRIVISVLFTYYCKCAWMFVYDWYVIFELLRPMNGRAFG